MPDVPRFPADEPPPWTVWLILAAITLGVIVLSLVGCGVPQFGTGSTP